jgi:hypothetical protein
MAIDKPRDRPTVPDVLPIVKAIYERHCAGCCLHIVTDDGNAEQECAEFCLTYARDQGHEDCIQAAEMLVQMTETQRFEVYKRKERT